ncbi:MAG TPA: CRISPR-associated protein Cas5 [Thermotogota bacterium]|nr:CRISPR-associated protein Cas5 [Thermotogota bacterium]
MVTLRALKWRLFAPSAHFRKPWALSGIRFSFPIPPYSSCIGFLSNIFGSGDWIEEAGEISLGVFSRFSSVSEHLSWVRNLKKEQHITRFDSISNRKNSHGEIEHPGGQSPVRFQELNDLEVLLYLHLTRKETYEVFLQKAHSPENWISHPHLGRAEDWVEFSPPEIVSLSFQPFQGKIEWMTWIPSPGSLAPADPNFDNAFPQFPGLLNLVPTLYEKKTVPGFGEFRDFSTIQAKLLETGVFPFSIEDEPLRPRFPVDPEENLPVSLACLRKEGETCFSRKATEPA